MSDDSDQRQKNSWLRSLKNLLSVAPSSQEELANVLKDAGEKKLLDQDTHSMIKGVLAIAKMQVKDIMIPRPQMVSLEQDQSLDDVFNVITEAAHSRFPVLGEDQDDVIGILLVKDFLKVYAHRDQMAFDIKKIVRPAYFVPESKRLDALLNEFRSSHNHLAIVVDEYGGIAGMATIEDILEEIVGDIEDEFDVEEENKIQKISEGHYHVHALADLEEINETLGTNFDDSEIDTIGGLVSMALGHVPNTGDQVRFNNWEITVIKADERRVLMVELKKV